MIELFLSEAQPIAHELDLGDVIVRTFRLYRRDFTKYVVIFLAMEAVVGILSTLLSKAIVVPSAPLPGSTSQQFFSSFASYFGAIIALSALTLLVSFVLTTVAYASAVKLASDEIVSGRADLSEAVRFSLSRILWIWVVSIVVGIIVGLGLLALVVPGIILAIMFSLVLPVIMLENAGFESLSRSRKLVSGRWFKSFALYIIFGILFLAASAVTGAISNVFGVAHIFVNALLSAFYLPLYPIMLTVYYYSNAARVAPRDIGPPPAPPSVVQGETKFCPSCGNRIDSSMPFCPHCGTKQTA